MIGLDCAHSIQPASTFSARLSKFLPRLTVQLSHGIGLDEPFANLHFAKLYHVLSPQYQGLWLGIGNNDIDHVTSPDVKPFSLEPSHPQSTSLNVRQGTGNGVLLLLWSDRYVCTFLGNGAEACTPVIERIYGWVCRWYTVHGTW